MGMTATSKELETACIYLTSAFNLLASAVIDLSRAARVDPLNALQKIEQALEANDQALRALGVDVDQIKSELRESKDDGPEAA